MPPKYRAHIRLLNMGKENNEIMKKKPAEIFKLHSDFKEAFGSSNNAWRSCVHRVRDEVGVAVGKLMFQLLS